MSEAELNETFEAPDGRKIVSTSNAGVSVTLETSQQAIQSEIDKIKLMSMKRGIRVTSTNNPGPVIRGPFF